VEVEPDEEVERGVRQHVQRHFRRDLRRYTRLVAVVDQDRRRREPAPQEPFDQLLPLDDELLTPPRPVRRLQMTIDGDPRVVEIRDRDARHRGKILSSKRDQTPRRREKREKEDERNIKLNL
jgi:hypothetical protein